MREVKKNEIKLNCSQIKRVGDMPYTVLTCNLKESIRVIVCHKVMILNPVPLFF